MKRLFKRIKDAWKVLTAEEYFVATAKEDFSRCTPGVNPRTGPIRYKYYTNTDRTTFYVFIKFHIQNLLDTDYDGLD